MLLLLLLPFQTSPSHPLLSTEALFHLPRPTLRSSSCSGFLRCGWQTAAACRDDQAFMSVYVSDMSAGTSKSQKCRAESESWLQQLLQGSCNICAFQDDEKSRRSRASTKHTLEMEELIWNLLIFLRTRLGSASSGFGDVHVNISFWSSGSPLGEQLKIPFHLPPLLMGRSEVIKGCLSDASSDPEQQTSRPAGLLTNQRRRKSSRKSAVKQKAG